MSYFKDYRDHVATRTGRVGKSTLWQTERLLVGLNHLDPGSEQAVHDHESQDKLYHVLEGRGSFTVGEEVRDAGPGHAVWAPAGVPHGVRNEGRDDLVLLVVMAPSP